MNKDIIRELQNIKLDIDNLENELQKMFEELRGNNSVLYVGDLNKSVRYIIIYWIRVNNLINMT